MPSNLHQLEYWKLSEGVVRLEGSKPTTISLPRFLHGKLIHIWGNWLQRKKNSEYIYPNCTHACYLSVSFYVTKINANFNSMKHDWFIIIIDWSIKEKTLNLNAFLWRLYLFSSLLKKENGLEMSTNDPLEFTRSIDNLAFASFFGLKSSWRNRTSTVL